MSVRQGSNVIAGGITIDNTPTSGSSNTVSSGGVYTALSEKADVDLSNIDSTGKATIVNFAMPDYASVVSGTATSNTWIQCTKDSFVCIYGGDPWTEDYTCYVSPDQGTTRYIVGRRTDDRNAETETTSFTFFVPAGWYFKNGAEYGSTYYIYPLKGVA